MVVCRQLEAAQPLAAQARRQPGDDRADVPAFERLFERPQAVAAGDGRAPGRPEPGRVLSGSRERSERGGTRDSRARLDDEQFLDGKAERGERRRRQGRGRIEHHDQPSCALRLDQHGREEADLADSRMRQQQLAQHPTRPAAAGQLGVQAGETAGDGLDTAAAELVAKPECGCRVSGVRRTSLAPGGPTPAELLRAHGREPACASKRKARAAGTGTASMEDCTFIQYSSASPLSSPAPFSIFIVFVNRSIAPGNYLT